VAEREGGGEPPVPKNWNPLAKGSNPNRKYRADEVLNPSEDNSPRGWISKKVLVLQVGGPFKNRKNTTRLTTTGAGIAQSM